jgi:hypothetical protein
MIKNGACQHLANGCAKAHNRTARSRKLGVIFIAGSFSAITTITAITTMINMMMSACDHHGTLGNKPTGQ